MPWCQTPSRKKKAVVFTNVTANAYQSRLNAGFSKVCEIFKVCPIESLKYIREFHTLICCCGDISTPPKRDAERNKLWLVVWHVGQTASWEGLDQWMWPSIPDFQPSVWRSGYARLLTESLTTWQNCNFPFSFFSFLRSRVLSITFLDERSTNHAQPKKYNRYHSLHSFYSVNR